MPPILLWSILHFEWSVPFSPRKIQSHQSGNCVEMTDVVFKYVSWPFNQKDFRGNFIIENEHKVTKSTIAFPFNSLCESICRMRNYCARYCTSIQQIRILTILNLEGYIRRKKKIKLILTSSRPIQNSKRTFGIYSNL